MQSRRERLATLPPLLPAAIREAIASEDTDQLHELVDGVAEHDAEAAEYLRDLVEEFAYDSLADLFAVRGR